MQDCPLHVKVEETRLENGSKNLKCHAEGNPGPVYVWQSTNNYFKPVIGWWWLVGKVVGGESGWWEGGR